MHCYVTQGIATSSKAIASYTQTVMQLDTKLASIFDNRVVETILTLSISVHTFNTVSCHFICAYTLTYT